MDLPPDPFEDLAAPPLRLTPSVRRQVSATPEAVPEPATQGFAAVHDDPADRPFELAASEPAVESGREAPSSDAPPAAPVAEAEPAPAPAPPLVSPAAQPAPASRGLRQLRAAVAVGLLTAAAIVALAVAFRPASLDVPVEPEGPTALGSGPVPAQAPASTAVAAASVRLRVDSDLSETRRAALSAAVDAAGYGGLEVAEVSSPIDRSRIEFFHPADEAAAEALARSLAPLTGGPVSVHDLSGVTLGAEPGRIDVWVAD